MDFAAFLQMIAQCCDNSINLPVNEENYAVNGTVLRAEKVQLYYQNKDKMFRAMNIFVRNYFLEGGASTGIFAKIHKMFPSLKFDSLCESVESIAAEFLKKAEIEDVTFPESKDGAELFEKMNQTFGELNLDTETLWVEVAKRYANTFVIGLTTKEDHVKTLETIRNDAKDPDSLVTDEISGYKTFEELGDLADDHPYAEAIDQLKKENEKDAELCQALDKANGLLIRGKTDALSYSSQICERAGSNCGAILMDTLKKTVEKEELYKGKISFGGFSGTVIDYAGEDTVEARIDFAKKLAAEKVVIPEENRKILKDAFAKISQYNLFDPDDYSLGNDSTRGFAKYISLRGQLISAIERKDRDNIISLQKEMSTLLEKTDEIISDLKRADDSMVFTANTSAGRNDFVPAKYRMDALGASRLNEAWCLVGICHEAGMDINRLIEDPAQGMSMLIEKFLIDNGPINRFAHSRKLSEVIEVATTPGNEEFVSVTGENFGIYTDLLQRALEGFSLMTGKENLEKINALNSAIYVSQIVKTGSVISDSTLATYSNDEYVTTCIERMIYAEPEDLDLIRLSPTLQDKIDYQNFTVEKPFDKDEYFKTKTTPAGVLFRAVNVAKDYSDPTQLGNSDMKDTVLSVTDDIATQLPEAELSETGKVVLNELRSGEPYRFKKTDLRNLEWEWKLGKQMGEKVTSQKYPKVIKELADLKKEYNNRSFFAKLFYSSVRRQNRLIEGMVNRIADDTNLRPEEIKENIRLLNSEHENGDAKTMTQNLAAAIEDNEAVAEREASRNTQQVSPEMQAEFKESIGKSINDPEEFRTAEANGRVSTEAVKDKEKQSSI